MRVTTRPLLVILFGAAAVAAALPASSAPAAAPQRPKQRPGAPGASATRPKPTPQAKSTPQPTTATPAQPSAQPQPTMQTPPAPPAPPAPTDPAAELRLGKQSLRGARAAEALIHLEWALKLYEGSGNKSGQAAAHDLLGELYERQGQYEVALDHFNQSLAVFGEKSAEITKVTNAASAASRVAPGAPDVSKAVVNVDSFNFNLTLSKIGNMHLRRGRADEARAAFARMRVEKPDTSSLKSSVSKTGLAASIGGILSGSKPSVTVPLGSVSSLFVVKNQYELYHQTILYATQEIGVGRIDYAGGQFEPARKHFENAVEATKGDIPFLGNLGQTRRFRSAARTALGDLALRQGRYGDAIDSYRKASKGAKDDKRPDLTWPAQRGEARALWLQAGQEKNPKKAAERRAQALDAYRAAVKTVEEIRQGSVRADEARTTFLATTRDVFDEAAAACAQMALLSSPSPSAPLAGEALAYADEGLRFAEQGRARSLLDLLGETGGDIRGGIPADLLRQKRENLERQNEIAAQLAGMTPDGAVPDKSVDKLEEELDELQTKFDSIENQIREQNPRYKALTAAPPLSLAEVQRSVLDDSTALLEYSLGEEASYLWAVTKDGAAIYQLPARAAIDKQAADLRDQLVPAKLRRALVSSRAGTDVERMAAPTDSSALPPAAGFAAASHALYATVLGPVATFVGRRRLLVAPEGALAYVPFEALVTAAPPAGGGGYAELPFLINTNEVVYTPSASVIDALRKQGPASGPAPGPILLVADPVFDAADPRVRGRQFPAPSAAVEASRGLTLKKALKDVSAADAQPAEGGTVARLAATRDEATQAAAAAHAAGMKADSWLDLDASEENAAARDLTPYRIVHFATHGLLDAEHPQFTGLVLTLVGNREQDGFLRTDEVFNLRLGRPLVMLSACETGLGRERRGEGVIGLTRAFMYAGAPSVGVTLWSVADRSTAELMTDFYRQLLGKEQTTPAAALRAARLRMIASQRHAAPFYWAPFVLVGDWRPL